MVIHSTSLYCPSLLHLVGVSEPNKINLGNSALRFFVFYVSSSPTWKHRADKMNREFTEGKERVVEVNSTLNIFMDSENAKAGKEAGHYIVQTLIL